MTQSIVQELREVAKFQHIDKRAIVIERAADEIERLTQAIEILEADKGFAEAYCKSVIGQCETGICTNPIAALKDLRREAYFVLNALNPKPSGSSVPSTDSGASPDLGNEDLNHGI